MFARDFLDTSDIKGAQSRNKGMNRYHTTVEAGKPVLPVRKDRPLRKRVMLDAESLDKLK
jgi:hypothetical protein